LITRSAPARIASSFAARASPAEGTTPLSVTSTLWETSTVTLPVSTRGSQKIFSTTPRRIDPIPEND
jgi:hypothetical protein